ncbi:MAG: helix-turn-helix domain-containing protein [Solirubrobacteraceae bacterium]
MVSASASTRESIEAVVGNLRRRRQDIALGIYVHVRKAVPDLRSGQDPSLRTGMFEAITAVLDQRLDAIEQGPTGSLPPLPAEAALQARRAARSELGLGVVLRRYIAGHRRLGMLVAEEVERMGLSQDPRLLLHVRDAQEAHLEKLTAAIEREYETERLRLQRDPEQRRVELVQRLLAGGPVTQERVAALGYELETWHLGVIGVGPGIEDTLAALRPYGGLLRVFPRENLLWAWVATPDRPSETELTRIRTTVPLAPRLAFGEPGRGAEGWRHTHQQAQDALQVLFTQQHGHVRYAEIAILTPWLEDHARAEQLVALYLAPLVSGGDRGATASRTLETYFASGRNISAAARTLGIDRRTVAHRLRTVERILGHPIEQRMAELELAVRLHRVLKAQASA